MAETKPATPDEKREAELAGQCGALGWELQTDGTGLYRVVDATTGTLVVAVWTRPDGFGYTLNGIEDVLHKQANQRRFSAT